YRRSLLSYQIVFAAGNHPHLMPLSVIVARAAPVFLFQTGIIKLAVVDIRPKNESCRGAPVLIGRDNYPAAVGICNFDLGQQAQCFSVVISLASEAYISAVPAITQHHSHGVFFL